MENSHVASDLPSDSDELLYCKLCGEIFDSESDLYQHCCIQLSKQQKTRAKNSRKRQLSKSSSDFQPSPRKKEKTLTHTLREKYRTISPESSLSLNNESEGEGKAEEYYGIREDGVVCSSNSQQLTNNNQQQINNNDSQQLTNNNGNSDRQLHLSNKSDSSESPLKDESPTKRKILRKGRQFNQEVNTEIQPSEHTGDSDQPKTDNNEGKNTWKPSGNMMVKDKEVVEESKEKPSKTRNNRGKPNSPNHSEKMTVKIVAPTKITASKQGSRVTSKPVVQRRQRQKSCRENTVSVDSVNDESCLRGKLTNNQAFNCDDVTHGLRILEKAIEKRHSVQGKTSPDQVDGHELSTMKNKYINLGKNRMRSEQASSEDPKCSDEKMSEKQNDSAINCESEGELQEDLELSNQHESVEEPRDILGYLQNECVHPSSSESGTLFIDLHVSSDKKQDQVTSQTSKTLKPSNSEIKTSQCNPTEPTNSIEDVTLEPSNSPKNGISESFNSVEMVTSEPSNPLDKCISEPSNPLDKGTPEPSNPLDKCTPEPSNPLDKCTPEPSNPLDKCTPEQSISPLMGTSKTNDTSKLDAHDKCEEKMVDSNTSVHESLDHERNSTKISSRKSSIEEVDCSKQDITDQGKLQANHHVCNNQLENDLSIHSRNCPSRNSDTGEIINSPEKSWGQQLRAMERKHMPKEYRCIQCAKEFLVNQKCILKDDQVFSANGDHYCFFFCEKCQALLSLKEKHGDEVQNFDFIPLISRDNDSFKCRICDMDLGMLSQEEGIDHLVAHAVDTRKQCIICLPTEMTDFKSHMKHHRHIVNYTNFFAKTMKVEIGTDNTVIKGFMVKDSDLVKEYKRRSEESVELVECTNKSKPKPQSSHEKHSVQKVVSSCDQSNSNSHNAVIPSRKHSSDKSQDKSVMGTKDPSVKKAANKGDQRSNPDLTMANMKEQTNSITSLANINNNKHVNDMLQHLILLTGHKRRKLTSDTLEEKWDPKTQLNETLLHYHIDKLQKLMDQKLGCPSSLMVLPQGNIHVPAKIQFPTVLQTKPTNSRQTPMFCHPAFNDDLSRETNLSRRSPQNVHNVPQAIDPRFLHHDNILSQRNTNMNICSQNVSNSMTNNSRRRQHKDCNVQNNPNRSSHSLPLAQSTPTQNRMPPRPVYDNSRQGQYPMPPPGRPHNPAQMSSASMFNTLPPFQERNLPPPHGHINSNTPVHLSRQYQQAPVHPIHSMSINSCQQSLPSYAQLSMASQFTYSNAMNSSAANPMNNSAGPAQPYTTMDLCQNADQDFVTATSSTKSLDFTGSDDILSTALRDNQIFNMTLPDNILHSEIDAASDNLEALENFSNQMMSSRIIPENDSPSKSTGTPCIDINLLTQEDSNKQDEVVPSSSTKESNGELNQSKTPIPSQSSSSGGMISKAIDQSSKVSNIEKTNIKDLCDSNTLKPKWSIEEKIILYRQGLTGDITEEEEMEILERIGAESGEAPFQIKESSESEDDNNDHPSNSEDKRNEDHNVEGGSALGPTALQAVQIYQRDLRSQALIETEVEYPMFEKEVTVTSVKSNRPNNANQTRKRGRVQNMADKPYKCSLCLLSFKKKQTLDEHISLHQQAPLMCLECSIVCIDTDAFQTHIKNIHGR